MMEILAWAIAALLVMLTVLIHYEVMRYTSDHVIPWAQRRFHGRRVMMVSILALLLGHIAEIWVFAIAALLMAGFPDFGQVKGDFAGDFWAFLYFSAENYTSVGSNDIYPHGPLRAITSSETLAGLMMIAWSASFTYLKMEQLWKTHGGRKAD